MRVRSIVLLAAIAVGVAAPTVAATPRASMTAGGRTIAGPGNTTVAKSQTETVVSNLWGTDACVSVDNAGGVDVTVNTTGQGQHSIVVTPRDSGSLCEAAMTTVTLSCTGAQAGDCRVSWRVDR